MEAWYRREMNSNYLIIEAEQIVDSSYSMRMLQRNSIKGLLKFRIKYADKKAYFYYEITSKQSLSGVLESRLITLSEIRQIILQSQEILTQLEACLLSENQLLFEKEYIYVNPESFELSLCVVPGRAADFKQDFEQLLQYILKRVDHQNHSSVVLAYGLFQECQKPNYTISDLSKFVLQQTIQQEPSLEKFSEEAKTGNDCLDGKPKGEGQTDHPINQKKQVQPIQWGLMLAFMLAVPFAVWLLKGMEVLRSYVVYLVGWEILCIAFLTLPLGKKDESKGRDDFIWSEAFEYVEEDLPDRKKSSRETEVISPLMESNQRTKELQTVLLADVDQEMKMIRLISMDQQFSNIRIPYCPFIIGKQSGLVDFSIDKDTVSRFHLRIDQIGDKYYITDLNSKNGTRISGRVIQTNEKVQINSGDYLEIADLKYQFLYQSKEYKESHKK